MSGRIRRVVREMVRGGLLLAGLAAGWRLWVAPRLGSAASVPNAEPWVGTTATLSVRTGSATARAIADPSPNAKTDPSVPLDPRRYRLKPPPRYTAETLQAYLHRELGAAQAARLANPLASSPELEQWARALTWDATTDWEKAAWLFHRLRLPCHHGGHTRTALEVFAQREEPGQSFDCDELSCLYVALARAVGLAAYYVDVQQDEHGKVAPHACAAVFLEGEAVLVDLTYHRFGAAHQRFRILDDLQTLALHLALRGTDPHRQRAAADEAAQAAHLFPDSPLIQLALAIALSEEGRFEAAHAAARRAQQLLPLSPVPHAIQGLIQMQAGRPAAAVQSLREALRIAPDRGDLYYDLGVALHRAGQPEEARSAFARYLAHESAGARVEAARAYLQGSPSGAKRRGAPFGRTRP